MLFQYRLEHYQKMQKQERLIDNCYSGLRKIQVSAETEYDNKVEDLFGYESDSVYYRSYYHGLFKVNHVSAFSFGDTISKTSFSAPFEIKSNPALVLEDNNYVLALSGNSKIVGNCYVPNGKINTTVFKGEIYKNKEPVVGNIEQSKSLFPELNPEYTSLIEQTIDKITNYNLSDNLSEKDTIYNSFFNQTTTFRINDGWSLYQKSIVGNVILLSDMPLDIPRDCNLQDVVIIAPVINISEGFEGRVQLFATDTIIIQNGVSLFFPSAIYVIPNQESKSLVLLSKNSETNGVIVITGKENSNHLLNIENGAVINGFVYNAGNCMLEGKINGSLFSHLMYQRDASAVRYNLMYNGQIKSIKNAALINFTTTGKPLDFLAWAKD